MNQGTMISMPKLEKITEQQMGCFGFGQTNPIMSKILSLKNKFVTTKTSFQHHPWIFLM